MLSNDIYDYYNVSQGKITIPNMDDGEECQLTDVSESIDPIVCNPVPPASPPTGDPVPPHQGLYLFPNLVQPPP